MVTAAPAQRKSIRPQTSASKGAGSTIPHRSGDQRDAESKDAQPVLIRPAARPSSQMTFPESISAAFPNCRSCHPDPEQAKRAEGEWTSYLLCPNLRKISLNPPTLSLSKRRPRFLFPTPYSLLPSPCFSKSTNRTSSISRPKNRLPKARNFFTESVAKNCALRPHSLMIQLQHPRHLLRRYLR
jgi:hypothetical protein